MAHMRHRTARYWCGPGLWPLLAAVLAAAAVTLKGANAQADGVGSAMSNSGTAGGFVDAPDVPPPVQFVVSFEGSRGGKSAAVKAAKAAGASIRLQLDAQSAFTIRFDQGLAPGGQGLGPRPTPKQRAEQLAKTANVTVEVDPPRYIRSRELSRQLLQMEVTAAATASGLPTCRHDYPVLDSLGNTGNSFKPPGIQAVQADQVPYIPGTRVKVCVIDTGLDIAHPDICSGPSSCAERITFSDNATPGLDPRVDRYGHGTHVVGTISALSNGFGVVGAAPGVDLHIVKLFDDTGATYASNVVSSANKCAAAGANIISMSLGGPASSLFEQRSLRALLDANILLVASAGNTGHTSNVMEYPASYPSVMSVAAVDSALQRAYFSTFNNQVDIAAPGVSVVSTFPDTANACSLYTPRIGQVPCNVVDTDSGSPAVYTGPLTATLVNCGLATAGTTCAGAQGKICLIKRSTSSATAQITTCQSSGGVAVIIYDKVDREPVIFGNQAIPVIAVPLCEGRNFVTLLQAGTVNVTMETQKRAHSYHALSGTSMAAPHVSAVAALVWSNAPPGTTARALRDALTLSAKDLGNAGRDDQYGFGLVQAAAAAEYMRSHPVAA